MSTPLVALPTPAPTESRSATPPSLGQIQGGWSGRGRNLSFTRRSWAVVRGPAQTTATDSDWSPAPWRRGAGEELADHDLSAGTRLAAWSPGFSCNRFLKTQAITLRQLAKIHHRSEPLQLEEQARNRRGGVRRICPASSESSREPRSWDSPRALHPFTWLKAMSHLDRLVELARVVGTSSRHPPGSPDAAWLLI